MRTILILLLFAIGLNAVTAQNSGFFTDPLQYVKAQTPNVYVPNKRIIRFVHTKNPSFIARYNPVSLSFGSMLFLYQKFLSPQFAADCPFDNSCSNYSKLAISRFGLLKGVALSADRLTRCNQFLNYDVRITNFNHLNKLIDSLSFYTFRR